MRIVVHGQQAFGKAVLEALLKRGDNVVAVYVAPEKEGAKADPLKEAALALGFHISFSGIQAVLKLLLAERVSIEGAAGETGSIATALAPCTVLRPSSVADSSGRPRANIRFHRRDH